MTILLLVSFVLGFVAILLSQFFRTYYVDMSEARLQKVATSVSELIEEGADVKRLRISRTNSLIPFQESLL